MLILHFIWALVFPMLLPNIFNTYFSIDIPRRVLAFMLQSQVLQLVDLLSRRWQHSTYFGELQVYSELYWLDKLFLYCIVDKGKAGSVVTYSRFFYLLEPLKMFVCGSAVPQRVVSSTAKSCIFGSTYVGLYRSILSELFTIVIVISIVGTSYRLDLSSL